MYIYIYYILYIYIHNYWHVYIYILFIVYTHICLQYIYIYMYKINYILYICASKSRCYVKPLRRLRRSHPGIQSALRLAQRRHRGWVQIPMPTVWKRETWEICSYSPSNSSKWNDIAPIIKIISHYKAIQITASWAITVGLFQLDTSATKWAPVR